MTYPAIGAGDFTPAVAFSPADVNLDVQAALSVPAASTVNLGPYLTTQPAYAIYFDAVATAATSPPTASLVLVWSDPATSDTVAADRWYPPVTTAAPGSSNALTIGRGPTKAGRLIVQLHNYDPANPITCDWRLWQNSRIVTRDDWRTVAFASPVTGYLAPNIASESNILGWVANQVITSLQTLSWECACYAGQAQLNLQSSESTNIGLLVQVPLANVAAASWPVLYQIVVAAGENTYNLSLPRCPVIISVTNSGTPSATVSWCLTAQEFAS